MVARERQIADAPPEPAMLVRIIGPEDRRTPLEILRSLELLKNGEGAKRENIAIALGDVIVDYSLVDDTHAEELKDSMADKWGQTSSITVRARELDGRVVYDIIDGFHRTEAKRRMGAETIKANVLYGVTDEELFDLRIVAANSVRSVQFPRIAEWISRSYSQTEWAKKDIPITQAFTLTLTDRETSYKVSTEDLEGIKDWVDRKCRRWQRSPGYIYDILKTVEAADPELVKKVRLASGGRDREQKVTPSRLKLIATGFPGKDNYWLQDRLMDASINFRLYAPQTAKLVELVKQKIKPEDRKKAIERIIDEAVSTIRAEEVLAKNETSEFESEIDEQSADEFGASTSVQKGGPQKGAKFTSDEIRSNVEALKQVVVTFSRQNSMTPQEAQEVVLRTSRLVDTSTDPEVMKKLLGFALSDVKAGVGENISDEADIHRDGENPLQEHASTSGTIMLTDLKTPTSKAAVPEVRPAFPKAHAITITIPKPQTATPVNEPESSHPPTLSPNIEWKHPDFWWKTANYLNGMERNVMIAIFTTNMDAEQAALKLGISISDIRTHIYNVLAKQVLYRRNLPKD